MSILKAGWLYFALVFGAGFVLGPIRVLWLVPRVGEKLAELMEMPVMLAVIVLAARLVVRRPTSPSTPLGRLAVGLVALGLLLVAELTLVLWLRGLGIQEYLANRDVVAGIVYVLMLGVLAVMPQLIARR